MCLMHLIRETNCECIRVANENFWYTLNWEWHLLNVTVNVYVSLFNGLLLDYRIIWSKHTIEMMSKKKEYFWCTYIDRGSFGTFIIFDVFVMRNDKNTNNFWKILFFQKSNSFCVAERSDIMNFFFNKYVVYKKLKWIMVDLGCIWLFL